jgi:hypothetical protein
MAGGSDHTGQADQDAYNLGNAVDAEHNADYFQDNAEWYAEQGNVDAAESSMAHADEYTDAAHGYADAADPSSVGYDVDHSSVVDDGGHYDMSSVDTGIDHSMDVAHDPYDGGMDDGTV